MKRMFALLLSICLLASLSVCAGAEQVKSVSIYTCYVENEALEMFEQFTKDTGIKVNYVRLGAGEIVTRLEPCIMNVPGSILRITSIAVLNSSVQPPGGIASKNITGQPPPA